VDNNHEIHGNEYLKAETANSLNLSLSYNLTRDRNSWEFKINAFYNSIKNAIQLAISQQQSGWGKYFNIDNTLYKTKGAEVGINYRYSPNLTASAGMISTGSISLDDPDRFEWSTDFISSATYRFDKLNVQAAIFYKYSDDYLEFAGNYDPEGNLIDVAQQFMSGYHTLDINLVKDLFDKKLSLSAGLKNIFNVTMVNSYGSINFHGSNGNAAAAGYGRTFFIGINYKFEKK
jgi:outer membrane receptor for ferrienterochelin and colicins